MRIVALILLGFLLGGCAGQRIIRQSDAFSQEIGDLPVKEVINNFGRMADNPYHIPTRTTFGNGSLQFTDNNQLNIMQPYHNIARNSGSFSATAGQLVDQYSLAIKPEVDARNLLYLRNLYHLVMYGKWIGDGPATLGRPTGWLYWTNIDGSPSGHEPPDPKSVAIGFAEGREFYVTDRKAFSDFVLATFGARVQDASGVADPNSRAVRRSDMRPARRVVRRRAASPEGQVGPRGAPDAAAPRNGAGVTERQKGGTPSNVPTLLPLR